MNRDGYGTKAFLAVIFSLVFAAGTGWVIYHFADKDVALTLTGALILIVRDIVGKLFRLARSNGEGGAKTPSEPS